VCVCNWVCVYVVVGTGMSLMVRVCVCVLLHVCVTVRTIDLGTNSSEPTSECGLGNRKNPFEPTTPLPSPQYGKSLASKISGTFC